MPNWGSRLYERETPKKMGPSPMQSFRLCPTDADWVSQYCSKNKIPRAKFFRDMFEFYRAYLQQGSEV